MPHAEKGMAIGLFAFVVLIYFITIAKMGLAR